MIYRLGKASLFILLVGYGQSDAVTGRWGGTAPINSWKAQAVVCALFVVVS